MDKVSSETISNSDYAQDRIRQLEAELDEMTGALAQAWDQLVPFLQSEPVTTGTALDIMSPLEAVMAAVDAPMGAVYLEERADHPEEWRTLPNDAFSLRRLQSQLRDHDARDLLRVSGAHPWSGQTTHWMFVPMVVDGAVAGAIGVGFEADQREFSNLDTRLLKRMAERVSSQVIAASLAESRAREAQLAHELQIAGMIQRSIQPTSVPRLDGIRVAADWMPASTVGGDAWGWTLQPSGKLACYVLDVAGKGLPASLGAVSLRTSVQMVLRLDLSPSQALQAVNNEFYSAYTDAGIMATLNIFTIDPLTGAFTQANAGHNPTLIRRASQWLRLPASTPPIGVELELAPVVEHLTLQPGDAVLCYSDGLSEIDTPSGLWGEDGILTAVQRDFTTPESMLSHMLASADQARNGRVPSDDQTVVCLLFDGLNGARIT